jgi:outer membrane lipoprotein SlyB
MSLLHSRLVRVLLIVPILVAAASNVSARQRYSSGDGRLSGTFELDSSRGDDPQRAARAATRDLPDRQRDRVYDRLLARLEPPRTLSIDRRDRTVTIASSSGPRTIFEADGRSRREETPNGRPMSTRADISGDRLEVSTTGNRGSDFLVTFEPLNRGEGLRVIRRFDSDELPRPVTVESYYRRVDAAPRWDLYASDDRRFGRDDFAVPDGTRIIATLDTPLSTRTSRNGERFSMTVRSPLELEGARIEGVISQVNTRSSPQRPVDMRVNFEAIRLRGGRTSEFSAMLRSIRTRDGDTIRVDSEGGVREAGTGADEKIQHGAVGAAIGAVIGALAGGGKGAAVGAVVGGAGGAILTADGRDALDLEPGTEVTMIATAPR